MENAIWLGEVKIEIWQIVKVFYLAAFLVYFLFALVAWRQIVLMSRTLNGSLHLPLKMMGLGLVVLAGSMLAIAFLML